MEFVAKGDETAKRAKQSEWRPQKTYRGARKWSKHHFSSPEDKKGKMSCQVGKQRYSSASADFCIIVLPQWAESNLLWGSSKANWQIGSKDKEMSNKEMRTWTENILFTWKSDLNVFVQPADACMCLCIRFSWPVQTSLPKGDSNSQSIKGVVYRYKSAFAGKIKSICI